MARTAMAYAIADGLIRGITFVLLPLLVVYLDRSDFGILGGLAAVSGFLTQFLGFGLVGAPIRFYHTLGEGERDAFLGTTFIWSTALAALISVALHIAAPVLARTAVVAQTLVPLIQLTIWTAWFHVVARTIPLGIFRARQDWRSYLAVSVAAFAGTLGAVYWRLVWQGGGLPGAVRGIFDGAAVTAIVATALAVRSVSLKWHTPHVALGARYGAPLIPHNVAHWTLGLSDRLLIGRFLGPEVLGLYHFAYQFASGLQMLITAVNGAIMPSFARIREDAEDGDVSSLGRLSAVFIVVTLIMGLALSAVVPPVIQWMSPSEYGPAAPYIPWLLVGVVFFGYYCIPANILTMSLGNTRDLHWFTGFAAVLNLGINAVLLPRIGIVAAVAATIAAYLVMAVGVYHYARSRTSLLDRVLKDGGVTQMSVVAATGLVGIVAVQNVASVPHALIGGSLLAIGSSAIVLVALWRRMRPVI